MEESKYSGVYGNVFAEISDLEGSQDLEVDSMVFVGFQSLEGIPGGWKNLLRGLANSRISRGILGLQEIPGFCRRDYRVFRDTRGFLRNSRVLRIPERDHGVLCGSHAWFEGILCIL